MLKKNDRNFFRPMWRRVVTVVFCSLWTMWEWYNGEQFWGILTACITAYAVWVFLLTFDDAEEDDAAK